VTPDLKYDLASLTKILATTFLVMIEVGRGRLSLATELAAYGWTGTVGHLTIGDLLAHRSGLAPWRPLYLLDPNPSLKDSYRKALNNEPLIAKPSEKTIYSDLNFLILGFILEDLNGVSLKELFNREVAQPLGLSAIGFNPEKGPLAPTEDGFRRGGPLNYPGVPLLGPVPLGRAHDDNAAGLNGVAGHAGLFGTAANVWAIMAHWAKVLAGQEGLVPTATLAAFLEPARALEGPIRAWGFDLGTGTLQGYVGHYGYTGGGAWWNPAQDKAFVLLCNRVQPTARNAALGPFRQKLNEFLISL
jgi:CubicO group peptidase (beta-lactamase class C family)